MLACIINSKFLKPGPHTAFAREILEISAGFVAKSWKFQKFATQANVFGIPKPENAGLHHRFLKFLSFSA